MAISTQSTREMQVRTSVGPDAFLVQRFSGSEAISELFQFHVDLLAENTASVPFEKIVGAPLSLTYTAAGGPTRHYDGIVRRFVERGRDDRYLYFSAEVVPLAWNLTRTVQSRIFQRQTAVQILETVLAGIPTDFQVRGNYSPHEFCVQYRESDFAFLSRLMEEEGLYYYFTHSADGHQMVIADASIQSDPLPEMATIAFDGAAGGRRPDWRIDRWVKAQEVRSGRLSFRDHSLHLPGQSFHVENNLLESIRVGSVQHSLQVNGCDKMELFAYPAGIAHKFDAIGPTGSAQPDQVANIFGEQKKVARVRLEQEMVESVQIEGAGNCAHMTPGLRFTLTNHYNGDGDYLIRRVEHQATFPLPDAANGETVEYRNHFVALPIDLPFRAASKTPIPVIDGPQTATVVGLSGQEIFTDPFGRIKVQFRWDRSGASGADCSCWVRVAQSWAGKGFGSLHIPRVGQEVVVEFLNGDPDEPIVTGSVYNAEQLPPQSLPQNRNISGLVSRSIGGSTGNASQLTFDDTNGSELVRVHSENNLLIGVENNQTEYVAGNRTRYVGYGSGPDSNSQSTTAASSSSTSSSNGSSSGSGSSGSSAGTTTNNAGTDVDWNKSDRVFVDVGEFVFGTYTEIIAGVYTELIVGANLDISLLSAFEFTLGANANCVIGAELDVRLGGAVHYSYPSHLEVLTQENRICMSTSSHATIGALQKLAGADIGIDAGGAVEIGAVGAIELQAGAAITVGATGALNLTAGAAAGFFAEGLIDIQSSDVLMLSSGAAMKIGSPAVVGVNGGIVNVSSKGVLSLSAAGVLTLSAGDNSIILDPASGITISGTIINLTTPGTYTVSAATLVQVANQVNVVPGQGQAVGVDVQAPPQPPPLALNNPQVPNPNVEGLADDADILDDVELGSGFSDDSDEGEDGDDEEGDEDEGNNGNQNQGGNNLPPPIENPGDVPALEPPVDPPPPPEE